MEHLRNTYVIQLFSRKIVLLSFEQNYSEFVKTKQNLGVGSNLKVLQRYYSEKEGAAFRAAEILQFEFTPSCRLKGCSLVTMSMVVNMPLLRQ